MMDYQPTAVLSVYNLIMADAPQELIDAVLKETGATILEDLAEINKVFYIVIEIAQEGGFLEWLEENCFIEEIRMADLVDGTGFFGDQEI